MSKVHRGCIYSGAAEQAEQLPLSLSVQHVKRVAFAYVTANPEMSPRTVAFKHETTAQHLPHGRCRVARVKK